jgi:hypothetical protein
MYLREVLEYLDSYGHSDSVRVIARITPPHGEDTGYADLYFQWYRGIEWRTEIVGGMVYRKSSDPKYTGWSVHT